MLKYDPRNTELLAQKQRLLQQEIGQTEEKLNALKEADKQAKKQLDSGDLGQDKYDALQREIVDTEQKLKSLNDELKKTSTQSFSSKLGEIASGAKKTGDALKPLSSTATALGTAMFATVPATEELRSDLSKLDNNAKDAGISIDSARTAFENFNIVSDEVDSSVEATSNLLQAGFTESNLQKAVEGLAGAYLRFPDTLKIESLADSLQETLATGQATGQFGELLDRLGIGADNFSAGLQQCATDADRQNYALQTLADSGLMDTYSGWIENNKALTESKRANMDFQQSISELANTLQPIITEVTEFAAKIVDAFNSLSPVAQNIILAIIGIIAALSPMLTAIGTIGTAISAAMTASAASTTAAGVAASGASAGFGALSASILPIIAIIAAIIAAVVAIIAIVKNWGSIVEWFQGVWNTVWTTVQDLWNTVWTAISQNPVVQAIVTTVQNLFNGLVSTLSTIWNTIQTVASNAWELIKNVILGPVLLLIDLVTGDFEMLESDAKNIWNNIKTAATNIWNSIKDTVSNIASNLKNSAVKVFKNMVSGIKSALSGLGDVVKNGFQSAIDFITSLPGKAVEWGGDFIDGMKDGIMSGIDGIVSAVKGVGDKIRSFLHFSRPDEGPLRDYETWMPDMMKGLANGIYENLPVLDKAVSAAARSINYEIMKDTPAQTIDYNRMYSAVRAGAENSNTVLYIGEREFKRLLKGMGVAFEG